MLKIEIRQHQHKDSNGNNVIVDCTGGIATYIAGNVYDYNWYDITDDCTGLDSIKLEEEIPQTGAKQREKGTTTQITIGFDAYQMIFDYLFATDCSFLNYFDARITDTDLNYTYKLYEIKPDNIEFCSDSGCQMTLPLREVDELKSVMEKLSINDNWQGWFGGSAKDFPCLQTFTHFDSMSKAYMIGFWAVIKNLLTYSIIGGTLGIDIDEVKNKAYGFGKFIPSPYIRDILENAMTKIGYTINTPFNVGGFAENDVFVYSTGYFHTDWADNPTAQSQKFIFENRMIWQLSDFLDKICELYNCIWQIVGTELVITPVKNIDNSTPVFEILEDDVVSDCKTFSFEKGKSSAVYEYSTDASDSASKEVSSMYNDVVDFDGVANNAMLTGSYKKNFRFASSSFWGDRFGRDVSEDIEDFSIYAVLLIVLLLSTIAFSFTGGIDNFIGALAVAGIAILISITSISDINNLQNHYSYDNPHFESSLKILGYGAVNVPRIVRLEAGTPFNNAKVHKTPIGNIQINPYYNLNNVAWQNQFNFFATPNYVFNYPLVFDANYFGNMYDTLHEQTDNSLFLQQSNEKRKLVVLLCKDYLLQTGINSDNDTIIGKIILYKGIKYKVLKYGISYSDNNITYELKKIK